MTSKLTRRAFLKKSSLVIAASALPGDCLLLRVSPAMAREISHFTPHAFVEIATDDTVTVWIGQTNLGQCTHTGISLIIAEELDADW
ncbi:twin-arginine translocation signal domain-containing protein [Desulfosediminicola sp.]|uniref:twin-arginine translocation signal domain-containing protein n=1 Tax=Desulfosediminicola sp. TaxID=2886825 RepID=UPI003AF2BD62